MSQIPKVKICCISSKEEATLALKYGASALGLVGNMPSGPGVITDKAIKDIVETIPKSMASFLLTSETSAAEIIDHQKRVGANTIQIVDALKSGTYQMIKDSLPDVKIVQVIHVIDDKSVEDAKRVSQFVDVVLLDSGNPNLKIKELGGTGRTHNWDLSKTIRQELDIPVFLAGGLNADNIREAILHVKPYGVDLCSGVRTNGKLDELKLKAFFEAVNSTSVT